MNRGRLITLFLLALLIVGVASPAYATGPMPPEETVDESAQTGSAEPTEPYEIDLSFGTQSPWTKKLPLIVKIKPNVDSTRTEVALDAPLGLGYKKNFNDYFAVKEGQVYEKTITLYPENPGTYTVTVNVVDWGYSTNRSSSQNFKITFGEDLVTEPKTANYDNMNILRYIINLSLLVLLGVAAFFGGKRLLKFLKQWLQPPQ
ncbi:MAG: hypothetical protein QY318_04420 [Candidatus Dojkabacteria bacterium]|nr:MAG: hypothetical protein QY318_04420 [Candidatus Dojkabacteria bacterium]